MIQIKNGSRPIVITDKACKKTLQELEKIITSHLSKKSICSFRTASDLLLSRSTDILSIHINDEDYDENIVVENMISKDDIEFDLSGVDEKPKKIKENNKSQNDEDELIIEKDETYNSKDDNLLNKIDELDFSDIRSEETDISEIMNESEELLDEDDEEDNVS